MNQSLTHPNCNIPYVISNEYRNMVFYNNIGIRFAEDDGEVIYDSPDLMIVHFKSNKIKAINTPTLKKLNGTYASKLRDKLKLGDKFHKGDIIFSYDCFRSGVPSYGYNVMSAYMPFFLGNHEDALVISENFANRAKHNFVERVFIPIFEHTFLQDMYSDTDDSFRYFPNIGQQIRDDVVAIKLQPKMNININTNDVKQQMVNMLKTMTLSELINLKSKNTSQFTTEAIKSKIKDGIVSGIKIHHVDRKTKLIDAQLEAFLRRIHDYYIDKYVMEPFDRMQHLFQQDYAIQLVKENLVYTNEDKNNFTNRKDVKECVYLIEIEVMKEYHIELGDKLCNRYANKGVVSYILPEELRPITETSNKSIDIVFNPFGKLAEVKLH